MENHLGRRESKRWIHSEKGTGLTRYNKGAIGYVGVSTDLVRVRRRVLRVRRRVLRVRHRVLRVRRRVLRAQGAQREHYRGESTSS